MLCQCVVTSGRRLVLEARICRFEADHTDKAYKKNCKVEEVGRLRWAHNPEVAGSNPALASSLRINSGGRVMVAR